MSAPGRNRVVVTVIVSTVLAMAAGPRLAAGQVTSVLERLEGRWDGEGELLGRSGYFEMEWEDRGGDVFALTFANGFLDERGDRTPVLDAVALYRAGTTGGRAIWTDSRGEFLTIEWEDGDSILTAHWRSGSEAGRTEYTVSSPTEVRVVDWVQRADGWRVFGRATYTRRGGSEA
jgi:hypothetical protein